MSHKPNPLLDALWQRREEARKCWEVAYARIYEPLEASDEHWARRRAEADALRAEYDHASAEWGVEMHRDFDAHVERLKAEGKWPPSNEPRTIKATIGKKPRKI